MGGIVSSAHFSPKTTARSTISFNEKTFKEFTQLADDLAKQVFAALSIKEKAALAQTSLRYHGLFSQSMYAAKLLMLVAHGEEQKASHMLAINSALLLEPADVTDYSGRTFKNITAYEYAYWAGDWHICRMLEEHMDVATNAAILERVKAIDKNGLTYTQHGIIKQSKYFDFTPLKTAYANYFVKHAGWRDHSEETEQAWLAIGIAQRDVPAYIAQEHCRSDRSFTPTPDFNEPRLPRTFIVKRLHRYDKELWFPLKLTQTTGLGIDFSFIKGSDQVLGLAGTVTRTWRVIVARADFTAVSSLETVSHIERAKSRHNLKLLGHGRNDLR